MAFQFFAGPNTEGYLARIDPDTQLPEVFWENRRTWASFPELDPADVSPISREQALARPGMTEAELDAPAQ